MLNKFRMLELQPVATGPQHPMALEFPYFFLRNARRILSLVFWAVGSSLGKDDAAVREWVRAARGLRRCPLINSISISKSSSATGLPAAAAAGNDSLGSASATPWRIRKTFYSSALRFAFGIDSRTSSAVTRTSTLPALRSIAFTSPVCPERPTSFVAAKPRLFGIVDG